MDLSELLEPISARLDALQHMQHCASCAEGSWEDCEGGRDALAAIAKARGTN